MDFLVSILAAVPEPTVTLNFIGGLIKGLNEGIGAFGLTIIVFTLILKLITLPIDIWQRSTSLKNAEKMKQMKPMMEKIDKTYGENKRGAQAEKQKLYKKYRYSVVSGCLPTLITMAFFIFMMVGLSSYTAYANQADYLAKQQVYYNAVYQNFETELYQKYSVQYDKFLLSEAPDSQNKFAEQNVRAFFLQKENGSYIFTDEDYDVLIQKAKNAVAEYSTENMEGFLWIKNIWRPDTWESVMPDYDSFSKGSLGMQGVSGVERQEYELIREAVEKANPGWNGLLLLPLLSLVSQFFSMRISMSAQSGMKTSEMLNSSDPALQSQKTMMWMMPIMMVAFSLFYTAAFALYIVSNGILSIASNLIITPIIKKRVQKKPVKIVEEVSYRR